MMPPLCLATSFSPQLYVGFLFLILYPGCSSRLLPPPACHTQHSFVTHHLSHTISHRPSFTYHLSHTIFVNHHLSHTIFHTPSLTHHLSHTIFHTPSFAHTFTQHLTHHLSHTSLPTTIFHTPSFTHTHHLSHTSLPTTIFDFAWQAWHLVTSTFVLRGRRGTYGTGLALVARLDRISRR